MITVRVGLRFFSFQGLKVQGSKVPKREAAEQIEMEAPATLSHAWNISFFE